MALTPSQLEELRAALAALARELPAALSGSSAAARPVTLDPGAVGRVSRIDAIQRQQMALAGRQALRARLDRVRAALRRWDDGEYGECALCGEEIGYARLAAHPETPLCLGCQERRESR